MESSNEDSRTAAGKGSKVQPESFGEDGERQQGKRKRKD